MKCVVVILFFLFISPSSFAQISHLELGAANYSAAEGNSQKRFFVLEKTLESLVAQYGPHGIIYLNDRELDGLFLAEQFCRQWLGEHHISDIEIIWLGESYSSRYFEIPYVKTAHLTNPGPNQLPSAGLSAKTNSEITEALERIANHSQTGLKITTYFTFGEASEMETLGKFLETTVLKKPMKSPCPIITPTEKSLATKKPR